MSFTISAKRRLLCGAAGTALLLTLGANAVAQTDEIEDEVIATGIRQSIEDSLRIKKEETSIVEAISAEDIGKLPDVSIADALARLPGVTAQRVRGRAQQISIRGLGPDFSIALLNGREMVSAGNNRGIEFDVFPSELIASGVVYKTPDARLAATGVAGAVDLRTVRPLDYSERQFNASAKYVVNSNGSLNPDFDDNGYRLFGSYIDQAFDGRLGWSIGITSQNNPTQFFSRELKTNQFQVQQTPGGTYYPGDNPRSGVVSRDFKRLSVAGTLQFEPTDRFQATVDLGYSDFEDEGIFRGVETPLAQWGGVGTPTVNGTGVFADSATYDNVGPILRTDTEGNTAEIFNFGLNTSFMWTDRLKTTLDISSSSLDKEDIDYESYAGTGSRIFRGVDWGNGGAFLPARDPSLLDSLTYTFPSSGEYSINAGIDYTDPNRIVLADPGGWGQVGFIKEPSIEDDLQQIRAEAEYEVENDFFSSFVVGALVTEREKTFNSNENFIRVGNGFTNDEAPLPSSAVIGATDTGSIGLNIVAYDPAALLTDGTYRLDPAASVQWTIEEDIDTFYAMANIDAVLGVPVVGNVGLQYVDVKQKSTGTLAGVGTQTLGDEYDHWLPSVNLSFEVMDDTYIRAAASKTVTRPRLDQMTANQNISLNTNVCPDPDGDGQPNSVVGLDPANGRSCFNLGGGNPELRPYESTNFDIAFEKYFKADTALSIALFHKEVENWIVGRTVVTDGTQQIQDAGFGGFLAANPEVAQVALGSVDNFEVATITGLEATVRAGLDDYIPFAGFGVEGSYTYADAELDDGAGQVIPIPGYSERVWSASAYYDNNGFRAKLNARYRSDFLSEIALFDGTLSGADALEETILDAQIGYEFQDGPLEGLFINFEAYNLTDEPFRTDNDLDGPGGAGTDRFISRHELYGTTYNFTVSKRF